MNQTQYIDTFKKALKGIDKQTRDNILLEIEGHISELNTHESIEERFGSPTELAKQYLEGETVSPTVGKKFMGFSKKLFLIIGVFVTLLILGFAFSAWYFSKDSFNYADITAKELNRNEANWNSVEWTSNIDIEVDQGRAIIYWHEQPTLDWNCGERHDFNPTPNKVLKIRHDQCLIFLPKQALNLKVKQADAVLVNPQGAIDITLHQSKLRIAEKGAKYQFLIDGTRSAIGSFASDKDAPNTITIKAEESQIEPYKY